MLTRKQKNRDPGLKAETSLREDIYLGKRNTMSDSVIAVEEGVVCARTVRITPAGERWNRDAALEIKLSVGAILKLGEEPEGLGCGMSRSARTSPDVGTSNIDDDLHFNQIQLPRPKRLRRRNPRLPLTNVHFRAPAMATLGSESEQQKITVW